MGGVSAGPVQAVVRGVARACFECMSPSRMMPNLPQPLPNAVAASLLGFLSRLCSLCFFLSFLSLAFFSFFSFRSFFLCSLRFFFFFRSSLLSLLSLLSSRLRFFSLRFFSFLRRSSLSEDELSLLLSESLTMEVGR